MEFAELCTVQNPIAQDKQTCKVHPISIAILKIDGDRVVEVIHKRIIQQGKYVKRAFLYGFKPAPEILMNTLQLDQISFD